MKEHVRIHRFYSSALLRALRLLIFVGLLALTINGFLHGSLLKLPLFFLSWFVLFEIFFRFSLSQKTPRILVRENSGEDLLASFSHQALDSLLSPTAAESLRRLLRLPQIQTLLARAGLSERDIPQKETPLKEWQKSAFAVAKEGNGQYVTSMDCLAAYLLAIEPEAKVLFAKELQKDDLLRIVCWVRMLCPEEETPSRLRASTSGDGIGEALTTGWTPETKKYTTDFTAVALRKTQGILGREKEYLQVQEALSKPEMNNILLVGEPGVGKEKLIASLAYDSTLGRLPSHLNHKRIVTLMVGQLLAGATNRAELEERLQAIIAELSHSGNIILYIPELQEIMGGGSYNMNLSGALLPYLKDGKLPVIATMTQGNFKTYMERNAFAEVFTTVQLPEPDFETAERMLFQKAQEIESEQHVFLPYLTIKTALLFEPKYLPDFVLPGSAITLLADAATHADPKQKIHGKAVLSRDIVVSQVEDKVHAPVAAPKAAEKDLLLHLETKLHERVIGQEQAISAISEAMRRIRGQVEHQERPISFLFLGPTGVGKTETAKALADLYFGGEEKMLRLDMSEYVDEAGVRRLLGAPPGSGEENGELTDKIHDNPYTLVLLDEFEKASPKVLDLFLQVLSDGRLTDNKGRTVSFSDAIIIATSNAGSEFIREKISTGMAVDKSFQEQLLQYLQTNHFFKPELLNRFDDIITFQPLSPEQASAVTKLLLQGLEAVLAKQDIKLLLDDQVVQLIAKQGYDEQFGARPLKRYIQDQVEDKIAKLKLEDKAKRGSTLHFSVDANNAFVVTPS